MPLGYGGSGAPRELAPGILLYPGGWNVAFVKQPGGTIVIEAPWSTGNTQRALDAAAAWSGGAVTAVISTSDSWPHYCRRPASGRARHPRLCARPQRSDSRAVTSRRIVNDRICWPDIRAHPQFRVVGGNTFVGSGPNRLEIVPYRTATGERQMTIYFPERRLLYTSDLFSGAAGNEWFTPQYLSEMIGAVDREHLSVDTIWGMHYDPTPYRTVVAYLRTFESATTPAPLPEPSASR